jgi:hypothetical protein
MILNSQRTLYGVDLALRMMCGTPYSLLPNTSLNEKFARIANIKPDGRYPTIGYYTIGVGGGTILPGSGQILYSEHSPVDAGLFEHIPFVMRRTNNDLTASEQDKYRMKVIKTINGLDYYAYYFKKIPSIYINANMYQVITENDNSVLSLLPTSTDAYLNPTPVNRDITVDNFNAVRYAAKTAKLEFTLLNTELTDLHNVMDIIYGKNTNGVTITKPITEIGICSGLEETIPVNDISCNGKEVSCSQIMYHVAVDLDLLIYMNSNANIYRSIDIGGMELFRY